MWGTLGRDMSAGAHLIRFPLLPELRPTPRPNNRLLTQKFTPWLKALSSGFRRESDTRVRSRTLITALCPSIPQQNGRGCRHACRKANKGLGSQCKSSGGEWWAMPEVSTERNTDWRHICPLLVRQFNEHGE